MKSLVTFLLVAGCAQPTALQTPDGGRGGPRRDGGLQFEEDGGIFYGKGDLATVEDLAAVEDLSSSEDLKPPPSLDMAGRDMARVPDMAHASVENCFNDLDDDGNSKINDGCPDTITVGADVPLVAYGGTGGGPVSAHCPANQVVTGLIFYADDWDTEMAGVGLRCATIALNRGASSYSVTLTTSASAPYFRGGSWDWSRTGYCDTASFQVAWNSLMNTSPDGDPYPFVHGLGMDCGQGSLTLSASNQLTIAFTNLGNQFGINYAWGDEHPQACGSSQALVGFNGRDGAWLDRIQPICAPLVVKYKP